MSRKSPFILLLLTLSVYSTAAAQLEGHFSLSKTSYSAGEPVFLIFEVENVGSEPVTIRQANPFSPCSGYKINVEGAKQQDTDCVGFFSCSFSSKVLGPGEKHVDRILLNWVYVLRQPGTYPLHVKHQLPYQPGDDGLTTSAPDSPHATFAADLAIVLHSSPKSQLKNEFSRYVEDLHSDDWKRRYDAAQAIADAAPPFLEDTIFQMLDSPQLRDVAVRGLHNLRTPAAHKALANFVRNSPPTDSAGTYQDAIRYLGDFGDHEDIALLLDVAHRNVDGGSSRGVAIESAGKVGGAAIPFLVHELEDESIGVRQAVVRALYVTGSRDAVPVLIELLLSNEPLLSQTAEFGLQVLTHFTLGPISETSPATNYTKWSQWWSTHRETATIFKYEACGLAASSLAHIE